MALRLSGLEPRGLYELELEVVPADCRRYKFVNSTWVPVGAADSGILNPPYPHSDSPNTGDFWMSCRQIQFNKVKLTNSRDSADGNVSSVSLRDVSLLYLLSSSSALLYVHRNHKDY